jgi:hypothetical protein
LTRLGSSAHHRVTGLVRPFAVLLVPLVLAIQLQRGLAEAHHNHDAPLTIEAPWAPLPCDLTLSAHPAVLEDPLEASLAGLRLAVDTKPLGGLDPPARADSGPCAPDAPRAPPLVPSSATS